MTSPTPSAPSLALSPGSSPSGPAAAGSDAVSRRRDGRRRALRRVLASPLLVAWAAAPLPLLALYLLRQRHHTLAALAAEPLFLLLTLGALVGVALICFRLGARRWLDRERAAERGNDARLMRAVAEYARAARNREELALSVSAGLEQGLRVTRAALLLRDDRGQMVDLFGGRSPLGAATTLARLLEEEIEELVAAPPGSALRARLPAAERDWLAAADVELLLALRDRSGELVAALALGGKRSGMPWGEEEIELVRGVAQAAAFGLEVLGRRDLAAPTSPARASECQACGRVHEPPATRCVECGALLQPALVPAVLAGRYRFLRRLGRGGAGVVYRATDPWLRRELAVKTLPGVRPQHAVELRREARLLASLAHPNLALVYDLEVWGGTPMVLLEYLPGGTLAARIDDHGPQSLAETLRWALPLCDALAFLHRRGVLHRDVKPSNIGFAELGEPKLLDFGLARLEPQRDLLDEADPEHDGDAFVAAGTVQYLSPEATRGEPPTPAGDLWALSLVVLESLTGRHPFDGDTVHEVVGQIQAASLPDLETMPAPVAVFFRRALHPQADQRPHSAEALRRELRSLADAT